MALQIDNSTQDASVTGSELVPLSDSGLPRHATVDQLKDFTIDEIEAITAAVAVSGSDSIFILQGGALMPVDIDLTTQYALDTLWGKAAEASPDDADILPLKDGATEKTITASVLAEYVRAKIEGAILDVSDLTEVSSLASGDHFLVTQGSTGMRVTYQDIVDAIYDSLDEHVTGLDAVTVPADGDEFYIVQGGFPKKMTLAQIKSHVEGGVNGSGTTDTLAQWSDTDTLQAGPTIVTEFDAGSDNALPSSEAVREEMDEIIDDATDIGDDLEDDDEVLVRDDSEDTQSKSALSRFWTYIQAKIAAVTDVSSWGFVLDEDDMTSDDATKVPTQQSVKAYVDANAGTYDGDITDLDIDGGTDIGADLADADLVIVDDGASGTNRKSALTRFWTYIEAKIVALTDISSWGSVLDEDDLTSDDATKVPTQQSVKAYVDSLKLDDLAAPDDNTDLDASTSAHGLMQKYPGGTTNFLREDGTFAAPPGAGGGEVNDGTNVGDGADIFSTKNGLNLEFRGVKSATDGMLSFAVSGDNIEGELDIDGGTDIGADLVDADLIIVDDGAGGTNRKAQVSRVRTYVKKQQTATYAANQTLTAAECNGYVIYVTAAATITLPAVADGMSVTIATVGDVEVHVDPDASDLIRLDGTALDDGDQLENSSTSGDMVTLVYYSADGWYAFTDGNWTDDS